VLCVYIHFHDHFHDQSECFVVLFHVCVFYVYDYVVPLRICVLSSPSATS
jgi:hypothetical protein